MSPRLRRVIGGLGGAAFVVAAAGLIVAPWPEHSAEPVVIAAAPAAERTVLACTGPLVALGADAANADAISAVAEQQVVGGADGASSPTWTTLTATDVAGSAPSVLTAEPKGAATVEAGAAGAAAIDTSELRGFAASACVRPAVETWLVGGSTEVGSADLVLLSNSGVVTAVADIVVYGAEGRVAPATGAGIVVAPGTQRVLPLASLAFGQTQPVLQVTASGAPLHVALQSSVMRTLVPGGVDVGAAVSAPSTDLVVPAVSVTGDSEVEATVRLLAPSSDVTASVTVAPLGQAAGAPVEIALTAGQPAVLGLPGLSAGTYTVRIEGSAPIVAAVWHATGVGPGSDFAWSVPALPLAGKTPVAVAPGPAPSLVLSADARGDRSVTLVHAGGVSQQVTVSAGRAVSVAVESGQTYMLQPDAPGIRAAVSYLDIGVVATYPVAPSAQATAEVAVTVP